MAHLSGLVAGGAYPNPTKYADVVTSTTHKVLRGPRGGIILTNNEDLAKKFNSAIFPGLQGGPLMHVIAAKAVCFKEALSDEFKIYTKYVITFDTESPFITSGIRLGTPACTTRGFKEDEFKLIADLIHKVIKGLSENKTDNSKIENEVKKEIINLCSSFPIYGN